MAAFLGLLAVSMFPAPGAMAHSVPPLVCGYQLMLSADPTVGSTPLLVHFDATVSPGTPSYDSWNFGDGTFWNASGPTASNPFHRFAAVGTYHPSVQASEAGCVLSTTVNVTVSAGALRVTTSATPGSGMAPLTVRFEANISGGSGTYISASWQFGDGGVGSGTQVAYTYEHAGQFTARLNVTDSEGHWSVGSVTVNLTLGGGPPPGGIPAWIATAGSWGLIGLAIVVAAVFILWRRSRAGEGRDLEARHPLTVPSASELVPPPPSSRSHGATAGTDGVPPRPSVPSADTGVPTIRRTGTETIDLPSTMPPHGRPKTRRSTAESFGITQQVILHIGRQGRLPPDDVAPVELTQLGIAEATGARQNTLTNILRRLVAAGVLAQDVRHVREGRRRLRVYYFTARGESVYEELRRRPGALRPAGRGPNGPRE